MTDTNLIALGRELDALVTEEARYHADGLPNGEAEAAEEQRLAAWSGRVLAAIAEERPTTPEGWAVKLRAVEHCNTAGELTPADRIAETTNDADRLAWAIVRDLIAERATA